MKKLQVLLLLTLLLSAFIRVEKWQGGDPRKAVYIPESPQRTGNADTGYAYLTKGAYVKGGLPYDYFLLASGRSASNYLHREGLNANVSHEYTVVKAPNGENLVAPNCMQCHAQVFEGKLVMGMGNSSVDFTMGQKLNPQAYNMLENFLKKDRFQSMKPPNRLCRLPKPLGRSSPQM
jgi:hypothetical protein